MIKQKYIRMDDKMIDINKTQSACIKNISIGDEKKLTNSIKASKEQIKRLKKEAQQLKDILHNS